MYAPCITQTWPSAQTCTPSLPVRLRDPGCSLGLGTWAVLLRAPASPPPCSIPGAGSRLRPAPSSSWSPAAGLWGVHSLGGRAAKSLPASADRLLVFSAASNLSALPAPATSKVIKTRYRIVKKTPALPSSTVPFPQALPSWRARRLSLSR